jgi:hypothetical protein
VEEYAVPESILSEGAFEHFDGARAAQYLGE